MYVCILIEYFVTWQHPKDVLSLEEEHKIIIK